MLTYMPQGILQPRFNHYKLDRLLFAFQRPTILKLGAWIQQRSSARAALGNDVKQRDIFQAMMNTPDPKTGEHLSPKDLWLETIMVLIAGSDTTSTSMAAVLYYLLHSPEALSTLAQEVRSQFDSVDAITPSRVSSDCRFVRACCDEAMRLTPPVVHGPPRRVETGGIQVNGDHFVEDTILMAPLYTMNRNAAFFESPDDFKPQRWMVDNSESQRAQQAFTPFHIGPYSWSVAFVPFRLSQLT
jgi:cytochrome P450